MAALPAGVQYQLSSDPSYKENKELVFVKLTDSALKAIEDFIRNNRDKLAKPKIQFLPGNEGKISIPVPASGNGLSGETTFHFSINSNAEMEGPQGSFECVRGGGARRLESCGPLPRRMRVQANDDSYEATKDRMARTVAAEQSKCTRVIKPNQTDIGRRVKVRSSHPLFSSGPTSHTLERPAHLAERNLHVAERGSQPGDRGVPVVERSAGHLTDRGVNVAERAGHIAERGSHVSERGGHVPERNGHVPERNGTGPERNGYAPERNGYPPDRNNYVPERNGYPPERNGHPPERNSHALERNVHVPERNGHAPERGGHAVERNGFALERSGLQSAPTRAPPQVPQPQKPPPNPELTRRSIKERLIQLLALKSFKKPELYARLNSEGIKEKERSVVNKILPQIGSLKDNCYHLRRHIWNDVNEDWPFYTEEEKRILKRRKPQNLTPPLSSDSGNSVSPRGSPCAGKRPGAGGAGGGGGSTGGEEPPPSKKRISHYRRAASPPSSASSGYCGSSGASSGERHASDTEDDRHHSVKKDNGYTLSFNTVKELCPSPVKSNGFSRSPPTERTVAEKEEITNTVTLENTELTSATDENMTDLEDIERQYPPITSSSTRRAYKNEFAQLYTEYRLLYRRVARVAELFTHLEQQLHRAQPHSPHHQSIEQRIIEEYKRSRNDASYQHDRQRVNYLHSKLTHIKRMVNQYDQLRSLKPERVSAASTTQAY